MKKSIISSELTPSEKEELIRLRVENEYLKKLRAVVHARKNQQSKKM